MAKLDEHQEYVGEVIDNNDPNCAGRCKIKVKEVMDGMDDALIPWASPSASGIFGGSGAGFISVPKNGTVVKVRFKQGDVNSPEYYGIQKMDQNMITEIKGDYIDTHVLCYDHDKDLSIMYQPNSGVRVYLRGSYIQVNPDGMITLNHSGNTAIIQLDNEKINITSTNEITINGANTVNVQGKCINLQAEDNTTIKGSCGANKPEMAVNGLELFNFLLTLANTVDMKYPCSPGTCANQLIAKKNAILNSKIQYV